MFVYVLFIIFSFYVTSFKYIFYPVINFDWVLGTTVCFHFFWVFSSFYFFVSQGLQCDWVLSFIRNFFCCGDSFLFFWLSSYLTICGTAYGSAHLQISLSKTHLPQLLYLLVVIAIKTFRSACLIVLPPDARKRSSTLSIWYGRLTGDRPEGKPRSFEEVSVHDLFQRQRFIVIQW